MYNKEAYLQKIRQKTTNQTLNISLHNTFGDILRSY